METENYYMHNLETGKLNVFTTKPYYQALSAESKQVFKRYCLWSKIQDCWVSKGKAENCGFLKSQLNDMGFLDNGTLGRSIPFEEKVHRGLEKAEVKAEQAEASAERAEQRSDEYYQQAKDMASAIPFGQPILVGHHSEKRDRNYRDKIHNKFGKAFQEMDKAAYYSQKAENAKHEAKGVQFKNPEYLAKKIKECQKNIRIVERRLEGKFYAYSPVEPINDKAREYYNRRLQEEQDKLGYYHKCMKIIDPDFTGESKISGKKKSKGISK